jgi:hypothetical protein
MAEFVAHHTDVGHPLRRGHLVNDEIGPALPFIREVGPVRPVERTAIGSRAIPGIDEEDAVEVLQRVFPFAGN